MEFKYISDPEIKKILENNQSKIKKNSDNVNSSNENISRDTQNIFLKKKKESSANNRLDSLKVKKVIRKKIKVKAPSTKNLALVTKQLAAMLKTGLPLLDALNIISESSEDKTLKIIFKDASISISRGSTFYAVLERYPNVFDEMYLALIAAGETAGLLPKVLERESLLLESLAKIKGQIKSALVYPLAIFILTILVVFGMLVFVIPVFQEMYANSGSELPAITQLLINISETIRSKDQLIRLLPIIVSLLFIIKRYSKTKSFKKNIDTFILKLPIIKEIITKSSLANFSRTLSALNNAGVPIIEALNISKRTLGNYVFRNIIDKMNNEIQSGQPIYKVLATEKIIPIMFTSMFRIGEETGELSQMIDKLADFYEEELSSTVKSLTSIIEPLMIVFVAVIVAVILIAMYLPMFGMMNTVG
tara:strand:+ start:396 stop:1655 length:1260 start_codon:yes stop_codon:yes gene_type:complete